MPELGAIPSASWSGISSWPRVHEPGQVTYFDQLEPHVSRWENEIFVFSFPALVGPPRARGRTRGPSHDTLDVYELCQIARDAAPDVCPG